MTPEKIKSIAGIDDIIIEDLPEFEWVYPKHLSEFKIPCKNERIYTKRTACRARINAKNL